MLHNGSSLGTRQLRVGGAGEAAGASSWQRGWGSRLCRSPFWGTCCLEGASFAPSAPEDFVFWVLSAGRLCVWER